MHDATRDALRRRADVAEADIDDIVAIAAELQEADRPTGATLAEVQAVARELDIAPEYVERAVQELEARRSRQGEEDRRQALRNAERRRIAAIAVGAGALVLLLLASTPLLLAFVAASDIDAATANLEQREAYVGLILDRQAALVPQLVALSGGDAAALESALDAVRTANDLPSRLDAARALDAALARVLSTLPPPRGDADAMQRLGLQHELSGIQNRLGTEIRRLEDARRQLEQARSQPGAGVASLLRLTRADAVSPPRSNAP